MIQRLFIQIIFASSLLFVPIMYSHADEHTTETTVTTTTPAFDAVQTTTARTEKRADYDTKGSSKGILGEAFHVVGVIISFPFIVIGKVLQAIF